ncbi:MMPL family transporter [Paenibacillus qinlingensis]|uniref:RND superfamily putative drug exporter n=1 Tax=Paenibacillus qinlingensis TaxID=1837343 RepID=A0ABU1P6I1_9BACL|nr:MMPL family transporter [Paenibacillus qinlingensis]MDR6555361.1 RND superfamily putative drug exporter [Paenibacillus qinlingensis]
MTLRKLAMISLRYPKMILLIWVIFFLYSGFFAPKLPTVLKDHGLISDGAFVKVRDTLTADFHLPANPIMVVFEKNKKLDARQFERYIQQDLQTLHGMRGLQQIISPLETEGMFQGDFAYALLDFKQSPHEMKPVLRELHMRLPAHKDMKVTWTGKSVVQEDVNRASQHDLRRAESLGLPAAFLILWLAFGGVTSAFIPIIVGGIGVTSTMGMMYGMGTKIDLSNFVLNVIPMVGLALSIDFALMMVSRFREEIHQNDVGTAILITMTTAGRAVLFSALSVGLGLMGILFIPLPMFATVALGAMIVVAVSVSLTLTLVPALLTLWWPAIQAERRPFSMAKGKNNFWVVMARFVMRKPVQMTLLAGCILLCCFLPLTKMKLAIPDATSLPEGYASRSAFEVYQTHFGSSERNSDVIFLVTGRSAQLTESEWKHAFLLMQKLEREPLVARVDSVFNRMPVPYDQLYGLFHNATTKAKYEPILHAFVHENKMLMQVRLKDEPSSQQVRDWLRVWEREGKSGTLPYLLGGEAKYQQEIFDDIFDHLPYVLLFILVSNYLVLFIAFRSILVPLKTIIMNLLSLGASFGILTWLFEQGHFGLEPSKIAIMIPVFIFGLAFGISMDYGVFLVSRIYEEYQRTHDNHRSVLIGLSSISKIINSAAAIMIAVTLPFAFGEVVGVKQLGLGIAAAIFIDATVIRLVLVPALMIILGKWNWWGPQNHSR